MTDFTYPETLPAADLKRLLTATGYAASTEATRYYLNGVYLHAHDGTLRAVATDGARMSIADCSAASTGPGILVPTVAAKRVLALLGRKPAGTVALEYSTCATQAAVTYRGERVVIDLTVYPFPQYQRVIPRDVPHVLKVDAGAFALAVKHIKPAKKTDPVRLTLSRADGLMLSTPAMSMQVTGATYAGLNQECGIQWRFLSDMLAGVAGPITGAFPSAAERHSSFWQIAPDVKCVVMPRLLP